MGGGSSGSYLPGPSYFEEQNSIESLNDGVMVQHHMSTSGGNQNLLLHPNQQIAGVNIYDELQDID